MRRNMGPLEAVREALATLVHDVRSLRRDIADLKTGQTQVQSALSALTTGQQAEQGALQALNTQGDKLMATAAEILADVQDESTVDDSIITLLTNIKAMLDAAGTDPAALDQVKALIDANKAKIAAAVVANTPAATAAGTTTKPVSGPTG